MTKFHKRNVFQQLVIFSLCLLFLCITCLSNISIRPLFFAPYLAFCFYRYNKSFAIINAAICGLITDIASMSPFGVFSFGYVFSSLICYELKMIFIENKLISIPIISVCISIVTSIGLFIISPLIGISNGINITILMREIWYDIKIDGCFAIIASVLPCTVIHKIYNLINLIKRRCTDY